MNKPTVVLGLFGTTLDMPVGAARWSRWRPTVSIFEHDDRSFARLELLHPSRSRNAAERVAQDIRGLSPETDVRLHVLDMKDPWDFEEVYGVLLDFARAYPFRPEDEDYLVHITTGSHVAQICLFLLTESRILPARLLQTGPPGRGERGRGGGVAGEGFPLPSKGTGGVGGEGFPLPSKGTGGVGGEGFPLPSKGTGGVSPPLETYRVAQLSIIDLDLARYDRLASRFAADKKDAEGLLKSGIDTRNEGFNRLIARIEQVAGTTRAPILLAGPTGAGKSQMARKIYALKKARRLVAGPLVEVNCATLRGDTAMSTLFGHVRGAFTGADRARQGLLLAANGGCLFLDEVGELGADEQAMLLRAIEEKRFLPVGSDREVESDFQLLAGTNRPLGEAVAAGRFREDLLARIDLWTFRLPGLRERPEDVEPNLEFELDRWREATGRQLRFNREARARFLTFATSARWSANFRDLNAAVTRMGTLAPGDRIDVATVEEEIGRLLAGWGGAGGGEVASGTLGDRGDAASGVLGDKGDAAGGTLGDKGDAAGGIAPPDLPAASRTSRVVALFGADAAAQIDRFDRVQLEDVLAVCAEARSLSEAGRELYAASRARKTSSNDADRLRKYLARFGLAWGDVAGVG